MKRLTTTSRRYMNGTCLYTRHSDTGVSWKVAPTGGALVVHYDDIFFDYSDVFLPDCWTIA